MALDTSVLINAMQANLSSTQTQAQQIEALANAIKTFVEGLQITYTTGLATASGGGPVSGTFTYTLN